MILITGGTGFIGRVLIRHLNELGYPVKLLLRPAKNNPNLPIGIPIDVAVTSLDDQSGLRAALKGVDVIYHLASAENLGRKAKLSQVDVLGTQSLVNAALQSGIKRFFYLSHLGSNMQSAYPLLKAKAIAERTIRDSGLPYTIFRSAIAYGEQDHFINGLGFLLKISPYFVMLPDNGSSLLQPIWVEDLATILTWSLDMPETKNQIIEIGGPEFLSFKQICESVANKLGIKRRFINVPPIFLIIITELLEIFIPKFPTSVFWMDYLATNRTTQIDSVASIFDLLPARLNQRINYLQTDYYHKNWWRIIIKRK